MTQRTIRALTLLPCAALILSASALQAAPVKSGKFNIPFAFEVGKHTAMPAGEYQIEQDPNSILAVLVNTQTGKSVMLVRKSPSEEGKARLVFEDKGNIHQLKRIS
jgi:hypothetical protein